MAKSGKSNMIVCPMSSRFFSNLRARLETITVSSQRTRTIQKIATHLSRAMSPCRRNIRISRIRWARNLTVRYPPPVYAAILVSTGFREATYSDTAFSMVEDEGQRALLFPMPDQVLTSSSQAAPNTCY